MQANEIQCCLWISITKCHFHITSYLQNCTIFNSMHAYQPFFGDCPRLHNLSGCREKLGVNCGQSLEMEPWSSISVMGHFTTIFAPKLITNKQKTPRCYAATSLPFKGHVCKTALSAILIVNPCMGTYKSWSRFGPFTTYKTPPSERRYSNTKTSNWIVESIE